MIKYNKGDIIGDLTILGITKSSDHGDRQYICMCACGNVVVKKSTVLKQVTARGYIASCGCRRKIKKSVDKTPTMI